MQIIKFLLFLSYATAVFFLPNGWILLVPTALNLVLMLALAVRQKSLITISDASPTGSHATLPAAPLVAVAKVLRQTLCIVPFILFTMVFNWWLDSWQAALWIGLKLLLVCNVTMIYASTNTITSIAETIAGLCAPLRPLGISASDVKILVSIALMMLPILKKDLREMREACRAKDAAWNIATFKMVLQKLGWTLLIQVNQLEEALIAKGYEAE